MNSKIVLGLQLERAVHDAMIARDDHGEVPVVARDSQARRERFDERHAALFMTAMPRPLRRAASLPCRSHEPAPRTAPSGRRSGALPDRAPSACALRCRSPDAIAPAAGRRTSASISGYMRSRAPHSRSTLKKALAAGSRSAFSDSCQTRSATSASTSSPQQPCCCISAIVSAATRKPSGAKRAAKRATRSTRTGSSMKASDTCRKVRGSMSRLPPYGSISVPSGDCAIALMVRSRRAEVLLERHFGPEFDAESAVARRRSCVRAAPAHIPRGCRDAGTPESRGRPRDISAARRFLARAAHDHPIALLHRQAEQGVSNRPADQIHLHG